MDALENLDLGDVSGLLNNLADTATNNGLEIKIYDKNPVIVEEIKYEDLKKNQLVTAQNVENMIKEFVMPKLYLIFGVLIALIILAAGLVKYTSASSSKVNNGHNLDGVITKREF